MIDTNLTGPFHMMQAAARQWRDHGQPGSIVNIVAVIWRGLPGIAHSCAARAGVIYLSKTLAIEWAPLGIRVNCVAPGAIATGGLETYSDEARRELPRSNLMQRFGEPAMWPTPSSISPPAWAASSRARRWSSTAATRSGAINGPSLGPPTSAPRVEGQPTVDVSAFAL